MRRPHLTRMLLGGLAIAVVLGLLLPRLGLDSGAPSISSGLLLDQPRPLKNWGAALVDDEKAAFELADFKGQYNLLFFGFASCPDVCPTTLQMASQMYRQLDPEAQKHLQVTLISVDPERDTPELLHQYVRNFHPDFHALTGPEAALQDLADQAGIAYIKVPLGDSYTIDHSAALVLLDPEARILAYFAPPLDATKLARDLEQIIHP